MNISKCIAIARVGLLNRKMYISNLIENKGKTSLPSHLLDSDFERLKSSHNRSQTTILILDEKL